MAACGPTDFEDDCVRIIRNLKTVTVPCTKNTFKQYTVKVPRQVTEQVPRTVMYTDYESRSKQVPYTVNRQEKRTRMETQSYQVPVTKHFTKIVMEDREKQVPVPYFVNVPETKYRTVTEQVPVQKTKTEMQSVTKTVYDTQTRTRCVPQTTIVTKQVPVYRVVPTTSGMDQNETIAAYAAADTNNDGVLSFNEFAQAQMNGSHAAATNPNVSY